MITDLDIMQQGLFTWCKKNFPDADATQELLGVGEELGELMHAHLKGIQGIREGVDADATFELKVDAVGDILIYLSNYCSFEGINLREALQATTQRVLARDWIADPTAAGEAHV